MFWQKQQTGCVTTQNNEVFILTFSSMVCGTKFVVFKKGTMRTKVDSQPTSFKELRLATDSIFSITVV